MKLLNLSWDEIELSSRECVAEMDFRLEKRMRKFAICLREAIILRPNNLKLFLNYIELIMGLLDENLLYELRKQIIIAFTISLPQRF